MNGHRLRQLLLLILILGSGLQTVVIGFIPPGDGRVRNTARVALGLWAVAIYALIHRQWLARWIWPVACAAFMLHVAVAFHDAHHWSHGEAFHHVEEVSGFGPGIFVSYFFTLVWIADAFWMTAAPASYFRRPRVVTRGVHLFMIFIIMNGTIIYENGPTRWVSAAVLVGLLVEFIRIQGQPLGGGLTSPR